MRLLIIRHADPEYVCDGLTEEGLRESAALAARLAAPDAPEGRVRFMYTSPMGRARDTARPAESALGLTAGVEEWVRELTYWPRLDEGERPGEGGVAMWDVSGETVRTEGGLCRENEFEKVTAVAAAREPFERLKADSDSFIARHGYVREGSRYRIVSPNRDIIAVFCHGGFGLVRFAAHLWSALCASLMLPARCFSDKSPAFFFHASLLAQSWLAHLLHLPLSSVWTSFYLPPSSITTVLFDERSSDFAVPRAIGVGDIGHLYANHLALPVSKYERPNRFGYVLLSVLRMTWRVFT